MRALLLIAMALTPPGFEFVDTTRSPQRLLGVDGFRADAGYWSYVATGIALDQTEWPVRCLSGATPRLELRDGGSVLICARDGGR